MKSPRLSILIPTRDRLALLKESLASARAQTLTDVEILVSDDGSSDATQEYVRTVAAGDTRVRLLAGNPRPGAFENIGYLIGHASGQVLTVLGDDDVLLPSFGMRLVQAFDDPAVIVSYGMFGVIGQDGRHIPDRTAALRRFHRYHDTAPGRSIGDVVPALYGQLWLGSCVFKTESIQQLGLDPRFGSAADWDLALRATARGASFFVPEVLWLYRDHPGTISRSTTAQALASAILVLEAHHFVGSEAEAIRLGRLRSLLAMQAWKSASTDSHLASDSLRRFDDLGGNRFEPRRVLTLLLLRAPTGLRRKLHRTFVSAVEIPRAIRSRKRRRSG